MISCRSKIAVFADMSHLSHADIRAFISSEMKLAESQGSSLPGITMFSSFADSQLAEETTDEENASI